MSGRPDFLVLPERSSKPRRGGVTHVLDKGLPLPLLEAHLAQTGHYVDIMKVGWGTSYLDEDLRSRTELCRRHDVLVCTGGTLLEIVVAQDRLAEFGGWAKEHGVEAVEVSNGLGWLPTGEKSALVAALCKDFVVIAETGRKDPAQPVNPRQWVEEMAADLAAGAAAVVAEGRESGTVGLFGPDGAVREDVVHALLTTLPAERVIFEAPQKAQQDWLIRNIGPNVNLGNIAVGDVLSVETLRLGLRADTAQRPVVPLHK
jgi:phosphosulfolactate synthase